jgi:prepilin-type N-terminal cleavage/methylation domain-containing protein
MKNKSQIRGFTLIELLMVITIISVISSVVLASLSIAREKSRNIRRLSDIRQIETALELYYNEFGRYPDPDTGAGSGLWDTPLDGTFLTPLVDNGFLPSHLSDPLYEDDLEGNYAYYRYFTDELDIIIGCESKPFYVLAIRNMEASDSPNYPTSPSWECTNRKWYDDGFEYSTGKYEY